MVVLYALLVVSTLYIGYLIWSSGGFVSPPDEVTVLDAVPGFTLREAELGDVDAFLEIAGQPESMKRQGWDAQALAGAVTSWTAISSGDLQRRFLVAQAEPGDVAGFAMFGGRAGAPDQISIGLFVSEEYAGSGVGTGLMRVAIMSLQGQGLEAAVGTATTNLGMQRIMERLGFSPEPGIEPYNAPNGERSIRFGTTSEPERALLGRTSGSPAAYARTVPDWTYLPLRKTALGIFGTEARTRRVALGIITNVARFPGGPTIIRAFDYTHDHDAAQVETATGVLSSPIGVIVPDASPARQQAFASMGFGFAVAPSDLPAEATVSRSTTIQGLVQELDDGATLLVANDAVIELGPTVAQRVNETLSQRENERAGYEIETINWLRPQSWPAWVWALWLGIAMVCGGIGAGIIALGPVMLPYDEDFLGVRVDELRNFNDQLIPFLQHDRITMAGCMIAIGFNDIGFALAMRRGWRWARAGFAFAGAVGFPTFFLFLGYRFFDPLHCAVAVGFFPLYLGGVFGRKVAPTWRVPGPVVEPERRRALYGQALMVALSVGVFLSGFVIMVVGLSDVLIPSDRVFLGADQSTFEAALDGRLLRFIAHDRAGFGGALASLGAGLIATSLWGWRAGERSTWWTLGLASAAGFGAALTVHWVVGYTDFLHLLPVYLGIVLVAMIMWLSRPWFFAEVPAT